MIAENNKRIPEVVEMVYDRKKAEERTEPAKSKEQNKISNYLGQ